MTYIARAELAAAVSEAGGLGMIETLTPEGREDLRRVRELTDKPVAANLMIQGWKKDPSIVDALAEAGVRHVFTSAGDPALFTDRLHDAGMTVVHVVGSLKGARKAADAGVDALVVEGRRGRRLQVGTRCVDDGPAARSSPSASTCPSSRRAACATRGPRRRRWCSAPRGSRWARGCWRAGSRWCTRTSRTRSSMQTTRAQCFSTFPAIRRCAFCAPGLRRAWPHTTPRCKLLGKVTDLYFDGDMEASVANTGQVSSRIADLLPVAEIVRRTWLEIETALDGARSRI